MSSRTQKGQVSRAAILGLVKTPLSFFVLFVLVGEAILSAAGGFGKVEAAYLFWGTIAILALPGLAVLVLTIYAPDALLGRSLTQQIAKPQFLLYVGPPVDMANLDVLRISWDANQCFIIGADVRERIVLVPSKPGRAFRVNLPERLIGRLKPDEPVELELVDRKGYRWEVRPFFLLENLVPLHPAAPREAIAREYGEMDE